MQKELVLGRVQIAAHAGLVGAKCVKRGRIVGKLHDLQGVVFAGVMRFQKAVYA